MTLDSTLTDYGFVCITGTDSMQIKSISYYSVDNVYSLLQRWEEDVCLLCFLFESHSKSTIDEIGELCGFSSRSRFHSAFKKYYNMTPGEFRKAIESK